MHIGVAVPPPPPKQKPFRVNCSLNDPCLSNSIVEMYTFGVNVASQVGGDAPTYELFLSI
jgi:hypothetical protein